MIRTEGLPRPSLQFISFFQGEEAFAFPMGSVREIIRMPHVAPVPLAPASLLGLANLRGILLPIVDLSQLLFSTPATVGDDSRVMVVESGAPIGFLVDRVDRVIRVDTSLLEKVDGVHGNIEGELLAGMVKNVVGHAMIMLLDVERLVGTEYAALAEMARQEDGRGSSARREVGTQDAHAVLEQVIQLVSFDSGGQEYAFPIEHVKEIVRVPSEISHVPKSASHVAGVINLRGRLLPLVSLRRMFSVPDAAPDERRRILVLTLEKGEHNAAIGIITDQVNQVLRVPEHQVDTMPGYFSGKRSMHEIEAICRLDGGKRVVSVLSGARMFEHEAVQAALAAGKKKEASAMAETSKDEQGQEVQLVVFGLAGGTYGFPIATVQEIIRVPDEMTHVPNAHDFIKGMVNLRGILLPVVDLRIRLGLPPMAACEQQRIVVLNQRGTRTGFIVDSVSEVLKFSSRFIEKAPDLSREEHPVMQQVANLSGQKRMIIILDAELLFEEAHQATTGKHH